MPTATCPGGLVDMQIDSQFALNGSTTGSMDSFKEFCGDVNNTTSAPDVVYQVKVEKTCSFFGDLTPQGGWDAALDLRKSACMTRMGGDQCVASTTKASVATELGAGDYWIVVDGAQKAAAGNYALNLKCSTAKCGDGVVNTSTGEECDGGPDTTSVAWDGCGLPGSGTTTACHFISSPAVDKCANITTGTALAKGQTVFLPPCSSPFTNCPAPFNLSGAAANYTSPNCSAPAPQKPGNTQVFRFDMTGTGNFSVTVGADYTGKAFCAYSPTPSSCYGHVLFIRQTDCETGPEVTCVYSQFATDNDVNTLSIPVTTGKSYWVFVQGYDNLSTDNGPYILKASLQ